MLVVFLAGCSNPIQRSNALLTTEECLTQLQPATAVTTAHVQPDAGREPVLAEIDGARCTLDLSMYMLTDAETVEALSRAQKRGVRVRVLLEREPFGTYGNQQEMFDQLESLDIAVKWSPERFQYSHAKYLVTDGQSTVITNQNFTGSGYERNREYGVVSTDPAYVAQAQAIFESDWADDGANTPGGPLVVSPGNAREQVLSLINSSQVQVWMYAEVLRDEDVTAALDAAAERGVDVRLLVNPTTDEEDAPYFLDAMQHGVQVRVLEDPYVHAKVMIIDGSSVLIGSHNYSYTSLELNREISVVLKDDANIAVVTEVYERDWARAVPVDTVSLTRSLSTYRMYVQSLGADPRMHVCR